MKIRYQFMFFALLFAVCAFTSLWVTPVILLIQNSHLHIIIQAALGIAIFAIGVVSALFIIILGTFIGEKGYDGYQRLENK